MTGCRRLEWALSGSRDCGYCFFQAADGMRYLTVTGVQTCALPISANGLGAFTNGTADSSRSGVFGGVPFAAGSYMVTDNTTGRGMMALPPLAGGLAQNLNFVF